MKFPANIHSYTQRDTLTHAYTQQLYLVAEWLDNNGQEWGVDRREGVWGTVSIALLLVYDSVPMSLCMRVCVCMCTQKNTKQDLRTLTGDI